MPKPRKIRIPFSEYDPFDCLGKLPDGTQFLAFVTGAFPADEPYYSGEDWVDKKKWLAVLHLFDADGKHISSESRRGGVERDRKSVVIENANDYLEDMFKELNLKGKPKLCDIRVRLFQVEIDNVLHGLIYEAPVIDGEKMEWVMLEPRDIMFHPPWNSGEYST